MGELRRAENPYGDTLAAMFSSNDACLVYTPLDES